MQSVLRGMEKYLISQGKFVKMVYGSEFDQSMNSNVDSTFRVL